MSCPIIVNYGNYPRPKFELLNTNIHLGNNVNNVTDVNNINSYYISVSIPNFNQFSVSVNTIQYNANSNIQTFELPNISFNFSNYDGLDINTNLQLLNIKDITSSLNYNTFSQSSFTYVEPSSLVIELGRISISPLFTRFNLPDLNFQSIDYDLPEINIYEPVMYDLNYFNTNIEIKSNHYFNSINLRNKLSLSINSFDYYLSNLSHLLYNYINSQLDNIVKSLNYSISYISMLDNLKNTYKQYLDFYLDKYGYIVNYKASIDQTIYNKNLEVLQKLITVEDINTYNDVINKYLSLLDTYKSSINSYAQGIIYNAEYISNINYVNAKLQSLMVKNNILNLESSILNQLYTVQNNLFSIENNIVSQIISNKGIFISELKNILMQRLNFINIKRQFLANQVNYLVNKHSLVNMRVLTYNQLLQALSKTAIEDVINAYSKLITLTKEIVNSKSDTINYKIKFDLNNTEYGYLSNIYNLNNTLLSIYNNMNSNIKQYYNSIFSTIEQMYSQLTLIYDAIASIYACADVAVSISRVVR